MYSENRPGEIPSPLMPFPLTNQQRQVGEEQAHMFISVQILLEIITGTKTFGMLPE